jgi:hypothetical protein
MTMAAHKGQIDLAELARLMDKGLNQAQLADHFGRAPANIRQYVNQVRRAQVALGAPLTEVVPTGFHLSSIASTVDENGKIRSQSYRAKSGEEGDVVPESGTFPAPDGMYVRSVSTLVDGQTGIVKQQWVKADIEEEDQLKAKIEAGLRAAAETIKPAPRIVKPKNVDKHLCNLFTLTDCHVGMLAWGKEAGEPWDLKIAERVLTETFTRMIDAAPAAELGIVNQLGDWLHFDSLRPVTPEHGNLLDADSRYQKVVVVAVRILRTIVEHALAKHSRVHVLMNEGNHDPAGSVWLRVLFSALYADNPRVVVEMSPLPYVVIRWGKTMLGFHHGHLAKTDSLPLLFAAKFHEVWGATTKRYIHTGHKHCVEELERPGAKTIQHPTLAAADAYAARGGWLSERQATSMTYSDETGEFARGIFIPPLAE